ncbi:MAG: cytochrome c biogenesis protein [Planctomycetota bacterium]|nr:cytochrome c biogenesis protein [Planctomycetota bacterium]
MRTLMLAALAAYVSGAAVAFASICFDRLRSRFAAPLFACIGLAFQTAAIGAHCASVKTHFFNSPFETVMLLSWSVAFAYVPLAVSSRSAALGLAALPAAAGLLAAAFFLPAEGAPLDGAFQRNAIFAAHIISGFAGYGLFTVACMLAVLYIEQERRLKRKLFGALFRIMPSLEETDRLGGRAAVAGLAAFSVSLACGAYLAWKTSALGSAWLFKPKIAAAVATWVVFAAAIVLRILRGRGGRTAAWIVIAGLALVLLTLLISHPAAEERIGNEVRGRRIVA